MSLRTHYLGRARAYDRHVVHYTLHGTSKSVAIAEHQAKAYRRAAASIREPNHSRPHKVINHG